MKKIVYFDCFSGVSGDMFLAAFIDAGAIDLRIFQQKLESLGLGKVKLGIKRVKRGAISATHSKFHVPHSKKTQDHRGISEIRALIKKSDLTKKEQGRALAIFQDLAKVEAKIHDVPMKDVHFHELGALDSILDIVGAAIVIEHVGIERSFVSKMNVGSGFVKTEHGRLPVPAPATLELLKGFPVYSSGIEAELTTPTGAAILKHLAPEYGLPPARWEAIGYGAGTRDLEAPNVLRVMLGNSFSTTSHVPVDEEAVVIETDIDDMSPQLLPYVQELLFKEGAHDVSWHTLHMKKNRHGIRLYVLGDPENVDALCEIIFRETTTLGVRIHSVEKLRLERKVIVVKIPQGKIRVKVGFWKDRAVNIAPEYEDCVKLAKKRGIALKEILRLARESAHHKLST